MLSAIPVALIANIARITLTGILHETVGGPVADHFYHDLAGWVMIVFALLLYWGEIWLLSHMLIEAEHAPFWPAQSMGNPRRIMKNTIRIAVALVLIVGTGLVHGVD